MENMENYVFFGGSTLNNIWKKNIEGSHLSWIKEKERKEACR